MRYQKKWRVTAALLAAALAASCVTGCSGGQENAETAGNTEAEGSKGTEGAGTAESGSSQSAETETRDSVVVVMGPTSEPEAGFDPAYGWGAGEHVHEPLIQSTLTVTTPDLKIGYDLAEDVQASEDGLTWQVKIRDDVRFTDGEPLTAEDVAFTYNTLKDTSSVNDFTMLKEAVAVDDTIGSGRYILKQWDKGQQVIFEANPDYYGEAPRMKKVTVLFMEEDAAYAAALSGQVDLAYTSAAYSDQTMDGFSLFSCETVDNRGFNLPAVPAGETDENGVPIGNDFTSDVRVRRAINLAIDRQAMIDHVLNGHGTIAYSVCDKMPWYSKDSEAAFDPQEAERLLDEAGWKTGADGIREKDGKKAGFTMLYSAGDSVRQALSEDTANQLAAFGIHVTVEGVGWDTAYDRAQSEPLMWGWGAHTPMELYNIYHTRPGGKYAQYSPYANGAVDAYMDEALACTDLEASYELWKKAQWDGESGITQEGDLPWIWLVNIDHLYWVKDGLQVAEQKLHPHGHGWSIVNNVDQWTWE